MIRKLMMAGLAAAAVSIPIVEASAATNHSCGNLSPKVGNIKTSNTSCRTARKVARADSRGKRYDGWKCHSKRNPAGASITCTHKGAHKVTYQVAD